ncbi:arylamine N-acetyltransferase [Microbacterium sp. G2-8]|uniref:arylamine N-acetyltransferase family protein n=1 Tax=Microbacterium sp. G2-8 TaxID=2842454 RepID=UPI001C895C7A|nr:arylamine N-acetyltransferase [Microbacterium sp. G2-8]
MDAAVRVDDEALWGSEALDLDRYLERIGLPRRDPSAEALAELHEAHVRTFTFDDVDVLLEQHPGVDLAAVQEKFLGRGRGGYCFEHSTLFAAALARLGYGVTRRLGRVGDPVRAARTHLVVGAVVDGRRYFCDTGFGFSIVRPVPWHDATEVDFDGSLFRFQHGVHGWELHRRGSDGWQLMHTTDELPVVPQDVVVGHHFTSTSPTSHFRRDLVVARLMPEGHVTLTARGITIRRPGAATERRELGPDEVGDWIRTLAPSLSEDELAALLAR